MTQKEEFKMISMLIQSSDFWVFLGDDVDEFVVVDDSVSVLVSIVDHLVDFSNWEVLSNALSDLLEFFWTESALLLDVEIFEELTQWGFAGSVSTESEDFEEGTEVHLFSVGWGLNDTDDLLGLVFNTEGSDGVDQLFSGDVSTSVIIEDIEAFFKLDDGFFFEVFAGVLLWIESLD